MYYLTYIILITILIIGIKELIRINKIMERKMNKINDLVLKQEIEYLKTYPYLTNCKKIGLFIESNFNNVRDVSLFNSGGGIWIYYILIDNKIYSIGDELFDGKNNCIIYHGFNSIDEFLDYEDNSYDDLKQEFIKI